MLCVHPLLPGELHEHFSRILLDSARRELKSPPTACYGSGRNLRASTALLDPGLGLQHLTGHTRSCPRPSNALLGAAAMPEYFTRLRRLDLALRGIDFQARSSAHPLQAVFAALGHAAFLWKRRSWAKKSVDCTHLLWLLVREVRDSNLVLSNGRSRHIETCSHGMIKKYTSLSSHVASAGLYSSGIGWIGWCAPCLMLVLRRSRIACQGCLGPVLAWLVFPCRKCFERVMGPIGTLLAQGSVPAYRGGARSPPKNCPAGTQLQQSRRPKAALKAGGVGLSDLTWQALSCGRRLTLSKAKVQAIIFDLDGTLIDFEGSPG